MKLESSQLAAGWIKAEREESRSRSVPRLCGFPNSNRRTNPREKASEDFWFLSIAGQRTGPTQGKRQREHISPRWTRASRKAASVPKPGNHISRQHILHQVCG